MKKKFTILMALFALMLITLPGVVKGQTKADQVYKTTLFGRDYNSKGVSGYGHNEWYATNEGFRVDIDYANNNNTTSGSSNNWTYIKIGGNKDAYTGILKTNAVIDKPITQVVMTIDAITAGNVTSMTLYSSSNGTSWTSEGTFAKSTGAKAVTISTPTSNKYYKIEVVCTKGTSNGLVTVSKVEYCIAGTPSCSVSPTSHDFGEVQVGTTTEAFEFNVTKENLTSALSVSVDNDIFNAAFNEGQTKINVTCTPESLDEANGTMTISGGGLANSITVGLSVTGTCSPAATALAYTTPVNLTLEDDEVEYTIEPIDNTGNGGTITYTLTSGDDNHGILVDNVFTADATGTYVVTATQAVNGTTCGGTFDITINVHGVDPVCTIAPDMWDFETVAVGESASQTFTVTTANLTGNITLAMDDDAFTVSPTTILQNATSTEVTITFAPTAAGESEAYLTANGGGISNDALAAVEGVGATPLTITFNAGSGSCTPASMSGLAGSNITLPTASPSATCTEMGWTFAGWATAAVSETQTAPTLLTGSYTISATTTLYAVYKEGSDAFDNTASGNWKIYATVSNTNYYATTINNSNKLDSSSTLSDATDFEFVRNSTTGKYAIKIGTKYLSHSGNNTNISAQDNEYEWTITSNSPATNGSWRITSTTTDRGLVFQDHTVSSSITTYTRIFGGYKTSNVDGDDYFDVEIGGSTVTYNSNPSCTPTCVTPTIEPGTSFLIAATDVTISTTTTGATIYYTTDGTDPTTASNVYEGAINVSAITTIKAMAVKTGYDNSEIAVAAYFFNSQSAPYTVAQARAAIDANVGLTNVYATGTVSEIVDAYSSTYHNISYNISTDGLTTSDQLQAFRGKSYNGNNFTSENDIMVGDVVVVYGTLKKYGNTYEFDQNNQLVSLDRPTAEFTTAVSPANSGTVVAKDSEDQTVASGTQIENGTQLTVTATPADNYRFASWSVSGDGATIGSTTTNPTTFQIGLADATVTATFVPTFNVTTSVSPENTGTVTASPNSAIEGETVALTITPGTGYALQSLSVYKTGDQSTTVEVTNNQFEMPAYGVTVTAEFGKEYTVTYYRNAVANDETAELKYGEGSDVTVLNYDDDNVDFELPEGKLFVNWNTLSDGSGTPYEVDDEIENIDADYDLYAQWRDIVYHITYSVNGTLSDPVDVAYGGNIATLPTPSLSPLTFLGWSTTSATGPVNVTTPYAPTGTTENITLYAVFGSTGTDTKTIIPSTAGFATSGYNDGSFTIGTKSFSWNQLGIQNPYGNQVIQFAKDGAGILKNTNDGGVIISIIVTYYNGSGANGNHNIAVLAGETISTVTQSVDIHDDDNVYTFTFPANCKYFVMTNNDKASQVSSIQINYEAAVPVTVITGEESLATLPATPVVVVKDAVLTFNGTNTDAAKLIIEDGGQLITSNSVKATMKKTTIKSTEEKTAENNWYAISSPIGTIDISSFVPEAPTSEKWNVYRYDEPKRYWNEYRSTDPAYPSFSTLTSGVGYLYRSTIPGIEFQGDVNVSPATYKLKYTNKGDYMNGFNLIGNPFSYNIYKGVEIPNDDLEPNFYVLEANGGWTLSYDHGTSDPAGPTAITPNTAILVQAISTANNQDLTISKSSKGGDYKYGNDQISFRIENSEYSDVACVLFREGHGLNKISHRNAEIPMLYVTKEGENFASANMPDNTSVINLGFEAKTMGQYTFSLKAEGQYSYMHLYDKLTGNDVDMLLEDSYSFIGAPSDRKDRFVLNLNYNAGNIDTESDIFAYQSGSDIMVSGEGELQVFDVMGRMVMSQRINGVETVNGLGNGVYIFRLEEKTQKIVVR